MTRRERLERKAERRREWAEKAREVGERKLEGARKLTDGIPLGQPILVGHHSERRHRRDVERIRSSMERGVEALKKADSHESKAAGLETQLEESIFSDDENAIEALERRAAAADRAAERAAELSKAWRKTAGTTDERIAALREAVGLAEEEERAIRTTLQFAPWMRQVISSAPARAAARRDRERIAQVKARLERAQSAEAAGGVKVERFPQIAGSNWLRITFAEKPEYSVIKSLKAAGFRWAAGSWVGYESKLPVDVAAILPTTSRGALLSG